MNKLALFTFFFIAGWFVPAWPLLLGVGLVLLIAYAMSRHDTNPPDDCGGADPPEPPPAPPGGRWINFTRVARRTTKPFHKPYNR